MGALKDRLVEQIAFLEAEIVRVEEQAATNKARLQTSLDTLKQTNQILTPEMETLINNLQRAGIKIFG